MPVRSLPAAQWNTAGWRLGAARMRTPPAIRSARAVEHLEVLVEQESVGGLVVGGCLGRVPDDVDQGQVVVADGMGVDREAAPLLELIAGAQVDHGAEAESAHDGQVGVGEAVQAVGAEERAPAGPRPSPVG